MATPLERVKSEFGSKEDLVGKLAPLLARTADESEEDFRERLLRVSNAKLLRLWDRESTLRETFGSREKLVDAVVELHAGDADFRTRMLNLSTGRLLDMHATAAKAARRAG